jgi:hypothetical protein
MMEIYSCHSGALCSGPSLHHIPDGKLQIGTQAKSFFATPSLLSARKQSKSLLILLLQVLMTLTYLQ